MSTSKSVPIRDVKAEHIGKLVTVRGMSFINKSINIEPNKN